MEANKAEEFFAGYDKESGQSMDALEARHVQYKEPEVEEVPVLVTAKGPFEGKEAEIVEEKAKDAGFNTSDKKSSNLVTKKNAEGVPKDGSKKNVPEKGGKETGKPSKKGHKTQKVNAITKGGRGGL